MKIPAIVQITAQEGQSREILQFIKRSYCLITIERTFQICYSSSFSVAQFAVAVGVPMFNTDCFHIIIGKNNVLRLQFRQSHHTEQQEEQAYAYYFFAL